MKWSGNIGYSTTEEDPANSGIYVQKVIERHYYGDLLENRFKIQGSNQVNDDHLFLNRFSIVADQFALSNFHSACYITYNGIKWKISGIDVQPPRMVISVSDVYNGGGGPSE